MFTTLLQSVYHFTVRPFSNGTNDNKPYCKATNSLHVELLPFSLSLHVLWATWDLHATAYAAPATDDASEYTTTSGWKVSKISRMFNWSRFKSQNWSSLCTSASRFTEMNVSHDDLMSITLYRCLVIIRVTLSKKRWHAYDFTCQLR